MNIPCPYTIDCGCSDNPLTNFSSETPDERIYRALSWLQVQQRLGTRPRIGPGRPPVLCNDPTSALYARLCADRISIINTNLQNDAWNGAVPPQLYSSAQAVCQVSCLDGGVFEMQVGAGQFVGQDQGTVDAQAAALACQLAVNRRICLGALASSACVDIPYDETMVVSSDTPVVSLTLVSGALPPGIIVSRLSGYSFRFAGIPSTAGTYIFALRATNQATNYMDRTYTIRVVAIAEDALPDATEGAAYLEFVNGLGGTAPYSFALVSGAFPAGITMDASGSIQGTPTASGDFTVTLSVTDSSEPAVTCEKEFTLHVEAAADATAWWPFEDLVIPPFIDTVNSLQQVTLSGGAGTVAQTAGKVGARALLLTPNAASTIATTVSPSSAHLITSNGFSITGWLRPANFAGAGDVAAIIFNIYNGVWTNGGVNPGALLDCRFQYDFALGADIWFRDAGFLPLLADLATGFVPTGAWDFIVFGYDKALGQTFFSLNNGALMYSGGSYNLALVHTTGRIEIDCARQTGGIVSCGFDEVNFYNKALDAAEIADLWNGGAGRTHP